MFDDVDEAGIGVIIRNVHGEIVASLAEKIQKPTTVIALELLAARRVALFTQEMGLHRVVLVISNCINILQKNLSFIFFSLSFTV